MTPTTRAEAKALDATRYFTGKPCAHGHIADRHTTNSTCVACTRRIVSQWRVDNRERYNATARIGQNRPENRNRQREWLRADRAANPDKYRQRMVSWYTSNKDRSLELNRRWSSDNAGRKTAINVARQLAKKHATPMWLTREQRNEIANFYVESRKRTSATGIRHHVDHIVPISGKTVCGLHVPWNLRVTTASENSSKKNRLIESLALAA